MSETGRIVAAAVVGHQPAIMAPKDGASPARRGPGHHAGRAGFRRLRQHLDERGVDTLVIVDTHWFTTVEHVLAGADHFAAGTPARRCPRVIQRPGLRLPRGARPGGDVRGRRTPECGVPNATTRDLACTTPPSTWSTTCARARRCSRSASCQTAGARQLPRFGEVHRPGPCAAATAPGWPCSGRGGMSHTFWPIDQISRHARLGPRT